MGDKTVLQNGNPFASMNVPFGLKQKSPGFRRKG